MSEKCIVAGCNNHKDQGEFVGSLCRPCHQMLTTGIPGFGSTFIHRIAENNKELSLKVDRLSAGAEALIAKVETQVAPKKAKAEKKAPPELGELVNGHYVTLHTAPLPETVKAGTTHYYTDGSCIGGARGGWSFAVTLDDGYEVHSGSLENTTNGRMEVMAMLEAIRNVSAKGHQSVIIRADAQYVVNGCNTWRKGWRSKGWRKADGAQIEHMDLWKEIDQLLNECAELGQSVTIAWVKGHDKEPGNEVVDLFAGLAARSIPEVTV